MSYYHLVIDLLLLQLRMVKQKGNGFITNIVIRLNVSIAEREAINRVHTHL